MDDITLVRFKVAAEAGYRCEVCGKFTDITEGQLAHRIPKRKWCIKKWGAAVIHHPLNLAWTCGLACNNIVSCAGWPLKCDELVRQIQEAMDGRHGDMDITDGSSGG